MLSEVNEWQWGKAGDPALHGRSALSLIELACHDEDALVYTLCTTFEQVGYLLPFFHYNRVDVISDMLPSNSQVRNIS